MKIIRLFFAILLAVVLNAELAAKGVKAQGYQPRSYIDSIDTIKKTANQMGYEDLITNELLQKYQDADETAWYCCREKSKTVLDRIFA